MPPVKIQFDVELLTPLLSRGALSTSSVRSLQREGLRPTIKQTMRYWYRALLAAENGTRPFTPGGLRAIRTAENDVFGSTDARPAVGLRTKPVTRPLPVRPLPARKKFEPPMLDVSGRHFVRFSMLDQKRYDRALAAWWLLLMLGGCGGRSRRMFGSLGLACVPDGIDEPWRSRFAAGWPSLPEVAAGYGAIIQALRDSIPTQRAPERSDHAADAGTPDTIHAGDESASTISPMPDDEGSCSAAEPWIPALTAECARIWIIGPESGTWTSEQARDCMNVHVYKKLKTRLGVAAIGEGYGKDGTGLPSPLLLTVKRAGPADARFHYGVAVCWSWCTYGDRKPWAPKLWTAIRDVLAAAATPSGVGPVLESCEVTLDGARPARI